MAAYIDKSNRFPFPVLAASVKAAKQLATLLLSLLAFTLLIRSIYFYLTVELSIYLISKLCSSLAILYLLTPTILSAPESILAYLLAALSSILNFGIPDMIA